MFVQVVGDLRVISYWIDTLVLKNSGKYLRYFAASPFPLQGKTNTCSRGSTRDHPPIAGDLRRMKQQPGETLQKYIQRFNNVRLRIPKVTDEAIISAFSDGVHDVKMKEELAIHEDLCMALEMFNMATKCARAEEGRLSLLELPAADPKTRRPKPRT